MAKIELTRCSFCVPLNEKQWERLNKRDGRGEDVYTIYPKEREHLEIKKLLEAGCQNLEWNGHFGRNLFFECDAEDAKKRRWPSRHSSHISARRVAFNCAVVDDARSSLKEF